MPSDPSESMEQVVIAFSGGMSTSQRFAARGLKSPASRLKNAMSLFHEPNSKLYFGTCSSYKDLNSYLSISFCSHTTARGLGI